MNKQQLIGELHRARQEWEETLDKVDSQRMGEPGVAGHWSVKDIIVHVSWSIKETTGMLRAKALAGSELWLLPLDDRNAVIYEQNRARLLAEVHAEFQSANMALMEAIQATSDEDIQWADWFKELPEALMPWQVIQRNVLDHYHHHTDDIRRWLDG